jgi:hypothetical protein
MLFVWLTGKVGKNVGCTDKWLLLVACVGLGVELWMTFCVVFTGNLEETLLGVGVEVGSFELKEEIDVLIVLERCFRTIFFSCGLAVECDTGETLEHPQLKIVVGFFCRRTTEYPASP